MNTQDFENKFNDSQLDDMLQQMQTLKKKLDRQEIVNDRIMRQSMKQRASNISRRYYLLLALCIFMIPYTYWALVVLTGFSLAFWVGTCILMMICGGGIYYSIRNVDGKNIMHCNLVDVGKQMARAKKFDADWLYFGVPAICLWLGWFIYEVYKINGSELSSGLFYGGAVGAVIGAIAGLRIHFNTQHQYQEIIDQIEDLTEEN